MPHGCGKIFFLASAFFQLMFSGILLAAECTFKPGEVVSADKYNECFNARRPSLSATLPGQWSTQCWHIGVANPASPDTGTVSIDSSLNVTTGGSNCFSGRLGVSGPNQQTYVYSMNVVGNEALLVRYAVVGFPGVVTGTIVITVLKLEPNTVLIQTQPLTDEKQSFLELWTRTNTTPNIPSDLAATTSTTRVTLSWTDASADETKFRIMRKDSLLGAYTDVSAVEANTTSYSETVGGGTYWYRVRAVNVNGDSAGSNVIKVTIVE